MGWPVPMTDPRLAELEGVLFSLRGAHGRRKESPSWIRSAADLLYSWILHHDKRHHLNQGKHLILTSAVSACRRRFGRRSSKSQYVAPFPLFCKPRIFGERPLQGSERVVGAEVRYRRTGGLVRPEHRDIILGTISETSSVAMLFTQKKYAPRHLLPVDVADILSIRNSTLMYHDIASFLDPGSGWLPDPGHPPQKS